MNAITKEFLQPFCGLHDWGSGIFDQPVVLRIHYDLPESSMGEPDFICPLRLRPLTVATDRRILIVAEGIVPGCAQEAEINAPAPQLKYELLCDLFRNVHAGEWGRLPELPDPEFEVVTHDEGEPLPQPYTIWRLQPVEICGRDFNAKYLWRMQNCLPGLRLHQRPADERAPLLFRFDGGRGLLMPLRREESKN